MVYASLVETVRKYQKAKLQSQNKPWPYSNLDWLAFDVKKLLEEVGELVEEVIVQHPNPAMVRHEIADVAIALACIASYYNLEISPAMEEKLAILEERMDSITNPLTARTQEE